MLSVNSCSYSDCLKRAPVAFPTSVTLFSIRVTTSSVIDLLMILTLKYFSMCCNNVMVARNTSAPLRRSSFDVFATFCARFAQESIVGISMRILMMSSRRPFNRDAACSFCQPLDRLHVHCDTDSNNECQPSTQDREIFRTGWQQDQPR